LKATVTALQEKSAENNHSLLKEVRDLKDIVAALPETNADTSTCASPESYIENGHSKDTQCWSELVRRKPSEMGKRKGGKGKGSKRGRGGSEQGQRVQPNVQSSPKQRASSQGQQHKTRSPHQFVPLPGKRKVWGTRKACSSSTVKNTITKLIGAQIAIDVKRKFKVVNGSKTVKWWHVQWRIQKIFEGSSFGGEATPAAKAAVPRGSGGMPPENFWKYRCSEVQFGAFLSRNRIATGLAISQTTLALDIALLLHCAWLFSSPAGD